MDIASILYAKKKFGGGGGGGGGDAFDGFHPVTITITGMTYPSENSQPVDSIHVMATVCYYDSQYEYYANYAQFIFCPTNGITSFELPLKEGYNYMTLEIYGDNSDLGTLYLLDAANSTYSGGISYDAENYLNRVTGDGSINIAWGYYD